MLAPDYAAVLEIIRSTRPLLLDRQSAGDVTVKGLADFVTRTDLRVQRQIFDALSARWPHIQQLGEEQEAREIDWNRPVWILDPVDGTTNLVHDFRESCVSLALWDGEKIAFGGVFNPFQEELFHAVAGQGAYCNGSPIAVSRRPDLAHSLVLIGTSPYDKGRAELVFSQAKALFLASEDIRRGGSAALDICYIAAGRAECYFEYDLKPWDFAAGMLILHEAGGKVSGLDGGDVYPGRNADIFASNGLIHGELLELLRH